MIYFYHHYELPIILHRYRLQQFILTQRASNANGNSLAFVSTTIGRRTDARSRGRGPGNPNGHDLEGRNHDNLNLRHLALGILSARTFSPILAYSRRFRLRFNSRSNLQNVENVIISVTSQAAETLRSLSRINDHPVSANEPTNASDENGASTDAEGNTSRRSESRAATDESSLGTSGVEASPQQLGPDVIATTSKNVVSCPDVVTSSSSPMLPEVTTEPTYNENMEKTEHLIEENSSGDVSSTSIMTEELWTCVKDCRVKLLVSALWYELWATNINTWRWLRLHSAALVLRSVWFLGNRLACTCIF